MENDGVGRSVGGRRLSRTNGMSSSSMATLYPGRGSMAGDQTIATTSTSLNQAGGKQQQQQHQKHQQMLHDRGEIPKARLFPGMCTTPKSTSTCPTSSPSPSPRDSYMGRGSNGDSSASAYGFCWTGQSIFSSLEAFDENGRGDDDGSDVLIRTEMWDEFTNLFSVQESGPVQQQQQKGCTFKIIIVFRGGWCAASHKLLTGFASQYQSIVKAGGEIVALCSQTQALANDSVKEWGLPFQAIGDPTNVFVKEINRRFKLDCGVTQHLAVNDAYPRGMAQPAVLAIYSDSVQDESSVLFKWTRWQTIASLRHNDAVEVILKALQDMKSPPPEAATATPQHNSKVRNFRSDSTSGTVPPRPPTRGQKNYLSNPTTGEARGIGCQRPSHTFGSNPSHDPQRPPPLPEQPHVVDVGHVLPGVDRRRARQPVPVLPVLQEAPQTAIAWQGGGPDLGWGYGGGAAVGARQGVNSRVWRTAPRRGVGEGEAAASLQAGFSAGVPQVSAWAGGRTSLYGQSGEAVMPSINIRNGHERFSAPNRERSFSDSSSIMPRGKAPGATAATTTASTITPSRRISSPRTHRGVETPRKARDTSRATRGGDNSYVQQQRALLPTYSQAVDFVQEERGREAGGLSSGGFLRDDWQKEDLSGLVTPQQQRQDLSQSRGRFNTSFGVEGLPPLGGTADTANSRGHNVHRNGDSNTAMAQAKIASAPRQRRSWLFGSRRQDQWAVDSFEVAAANLDAGGNAPRCGSGFSESGSVCESNPSSPRGSTGGNRMSFLWRQKKTEGGASHPPKTGGPGQSRNRL